MEWESVAPGQEAPPQVYEVTAENIADFCRRARYENLVYTSQPAAREGGLPGIIAPPGMVFVYAPLALAQLVEEWGRTDAGSLSTTRVDISCQGPLVLPGDVITSVTTVQDKFQEGQERFVTLRVTGTNQRHERAADYSWTFRCSSAASAAAEGH